MRIVHLLLMAYIEQHSDDNSDIDVDDENIENRQIDNEDIDSHYDEDQVTEIELPPEMSSHMPEYDNEGVFPQHTFGAMARIPVLM